MAQLEDLFSLIHALSKSEKRYFKMSCGLQEGDKAYLQLFEEIDKSATADSAYQRIKKLFGDKDQSPTRKHLYRILLRSIRNFEADKSTENKLLSLIADVRILFNKGLTRLCFQEIRKGQEIAFRYEKFFLYLILARMELQYLTMLQFPDITESELLDKQNKINDLLYYELFINRHSSLYEILSYRYLKKGGIRSEGDVSQLNDLLLEEYQVNANPHYNSFESDKVHLHFQATYFMMSGDYEQSLHEFYGLNRLFEKNKHQWIDEPIYYIYLIHGILTDLRSVQRYKDMEYFMEELQAVGEKSEGYKFLARHIIYLHSIAICIDSRDYEKGVALIREYESDTSPGSGRVPDNFQVLFKLNCSVLFFKIKDFHRALSYVNDILNKKENTLSSLNYSLGRILNLVIHLELANHDLLKYELRSFERKFKGKDRLFKVEKFTLDFLKKWLRASPKEIKTAFSSFYEQLKSLENDKYENQLLRIVDLRNWVEEKVKG